VRVAYDGPLGYALGAWVNPYQWATWWSPADTPGLLGRVLDVVERRAEVPAPGDPALPRPVPTDDFLRPEPAVDLSDLTSPGLALRPDDPFYIARVADHPVLAAAHRLEEAVVIKAPRQFGKSSLLRRYLAECRRAGKATALVDLSLFDDALLTDYPRLLAWLARQIYRGFGLDGRPAVADQEEMTDFVADDLLKAVGSNLVVALDEADRVLGQAYQQGFFSMLRSWLDTRSDPTRPDWARLELAVSISTEPYLLIDDGYRSPFNVRPPLELGPFNPAECRALNARYSRRVLSDEEAERLRAELLSGYPFLTRLAYYYLLQPGAPDLEIFLRGAAEPDGPFGDHLRALLSKLRRYQPADLLAAMRQVCRHGTVPDDGTFYRLRGAGLVRREGRKVVPGNGLYARFFKDLT
jgi:hypothetical protein